MKIIIFNKKTLFFFLLIFLIIIIALIFSLRLIKSEEVLYQEPYYQGEKDLKIVAFACNIDWGSEYLDDFLEIFKENQVKITFFPTGKWAEKNQDLLKKLSDHDHEIGNHGFNHLDYENLDYNQNYEEIKKSDSIISEIVNKELVYFAPPSGSFNDYTLKAAEELGYKTILWSIDTIDWRQDSTSDVILNRMKGKLHNSAIILMHPTEETRKALPELINYIKSEGYKVGRISDVL